MFLFGSYNISRIFVKEITTKTIEIMTTEELYTLASELTEQQVLNIVKGWENENDKKALETYNFLSTTGDSIQMACATVIWEKANDLGQSEMYNIAYNS